MIQCLQSYPDEIYVHVINTYIHTHILYVIIHTYIIYAYFYSYSTYPHYHPRITASFPDSKKDAPASGASSKPLRTASAMLLSQRQNEEMAIFDMDMSKNL